jgi:hypothetical protein
LAKVGAGGTRREASNLRSANARAMKPSAANLLKYLERI